MACLLLVIFTIGIVSNAQENAYQILDIQLPLPLMEPITAIYNDYLYVYGGRQTSGLYNTNIYRLSLNGKISLSGTTDITSTLSQDDWEQETPTAPSYGDNTDGTFYCQGQCSTLVDNYLYMVNPSSLAADSTTVANTVYRLDLSQWPPVFADESDFTSSVGYVREARAQCVTAADGKMYTITGSITGSVWSVETVAYDPSTDSLSIHSLKHANSRYIYLYLSTYDIRTENLANMTYANGDSYYEEPGRRTAGCAPNLAGVGVYLFGGATDNDQYGAPGVDVYDITNN